MLNEEDKHKRPVAGSERKGSQPELKKSSHAG